MAFNAISSVCAGILTAGEGPARKGCLVRSVPRLLVLLLTLLFGSEAMAAEAAVTGIRLGDRANGTRVVLDITGDIHHRVFTLADPYRVVIDLPEIEWRLPGLTLSVGGGLVRQFRYGLFEPGVSRVVLDVSGPVVVTRSFMLRPTADFGYRLVLDLELVSAENFTARAKTTPPPETTSQTRAATLAEPAPKPRGDKPIIVVDAGHGGIDPGTTGLSGGYEKTVTLAFALELKRQIEAAGRYRVMLTRERDIFISLRKRVELARVNGADLFISLHADALANRRVSGAAVYTLSEKASDAEAEELAAKENKSDVIAGVNLADEGYDENVANILIELAIRETMNQSAEFAGFIIPELGKEIGLLRKTHRYAGFRVLKAPDVPSVLIEMGYLSNPGDEARLLDANHRRHLMGAVVRAVDGYFQARDRG